MQTATVSSAEVVILVSDKSTLNFTLPPKKLPEIKDILQWLKRSIHQEDVRIVNIYDN